MTNEYNCGLTDDSCSLRWRLPGKTGSAALLYNSVPQPFLSMAHPPLTMASEGIPQNFALLSNRYKTVHGHKRFGSYM
jgi:hypothetical protein